MVQGQPPVAQCGRKESIVETLNDVESKRLEVSTTFQSGAPDDMLQCSMPPQGTVLSPLAQRGREQFLTEALGTAAHH